MQIMTVKKCFLIGGGCIYLWPYMFLFVMYFLQVSEAESSDDFEDSQSLNDDTDIDPPSKVNVLEA